MAGGAPAHRRPVVTTLWLLVLAAVLVVSAFSFAMVEAALSRVSRVHVEEAVRESRPGARSLQAIEQDAARYLNVITFLRICAEVVSAAVVTYASLRAFGTSVWSVLLAAAVMVVVSYVVVGVSPRTLGRQHADSVALWAAPAVRRTALLLAPLTTALILLGNAITPGKGFAEGPFASEAELRDLVDLAEENAVIEEDERAMIHGVFELGDTVVREIMVPRNDMVWIERGKTLRQGLSLALRSGFSRIPVVGEGGLDDVVGVIYLKDLVRRTHDYHEGESTEKVDSIMRPPAFVPESKPVDSLLREMQADRTHLAVVIDEYGGVAGLVTIEDVLEEIVGDIADEYDRGVPEVQRLDDQRLRVSARLNLGDLSEIIDLDLEDEDVDTVGGLLAKHLGRVPIPGAEVEVEGVRLTAEASLGRRNRVGTVLVDLPVPAEAATATDGTAGVDAPPSSHDSQEQVHS
ncbi:hemolysin family protein [Motilibacter peucedani]|uniref:hemolysin family protein n=1 Tax=Motilibacter peucedani TaxID=598650 RepID=UPI0038B272F1